MTVSYHSSLVIERAGRLEANWVTALGRCRKVGREKNKKLQAVRVCPSELD